LDSIAGGSGAGLSAGQRQLLTFGRTLLQGTRLVMMDEPTASVDMQTDRVLQSLAHASFEGKTVFTIAHRLETVKLSDRIVVMEAGHVAELGTPDELLDNPNSHLARMSLASGGGPDCGNGVKAGMREISCLGAFLRSSA